MGIVSIICWIVYGVIAGSLARFIHPGKDPEGFLPTVAIGVCGSFVGGFLNYLLGRGISPLQSSGLIMGILGGVICCFLYSKYMDNQK